MSEPREKFDIFFMLYLEIHLTLIFGTGEVPPTSHTHQAVINGCQYHLPSNRRLGRAYGRTSASLSFSAEPNAAHIKYAPSCPNLNGRSLQTGKHIYKFRLN